MERKLFLALFACIAIFIQYVDASDESNVQNDGKLFAKNLFDIKFINSVQSLWKAGNSSLSRFGLKEWKKKLGIRLNPKKLQMLRKSFAKKFPFMAKAGVSSDLPESFDAREAWPACKSLISKIRDQSACGSCWAVASASVASDRNCIASNGTFNRALSAEDMMRCCHRCKGKGDNGCEGGDIAEATYYLMRQGIVTGGEYDSKEGCMPYSFAPCTSADLKNGNVACAYVQKGAKTEKCERKCTNSEYKTLFWDDKQIADKAFLIQNNDNYIKEELIAGGSCLATMEVSEDFMQYKSGIYQRVQGKYLGNHGVRLLGWGTENGVDYWLAANSWGESWGEKGLLRVHRKNSKCNFAKYVICPYF